MSDSGATPGPGHNSGEKSFSQRRLKSFIERIERLEEEKKALSTDIKEVYSEAKSGGFDVKIIREVVKLRKMDAVDRAERQALLDVYLDAIGELKGTPLGEAGAKAMGVQ